MKSSRTIAVAILFVTLTMLAGCAADISRRATTFTPLAAQPGRSMVIKQEVTVTPSTGYSQTLRAGSIWGHVGDIPEGAVYKIQNDVFTVEGAHRHEAYCVIAGGKLIGFYLPVEQAFVDVAPNVVLAIHYQ